MKSFKCLMVGGPRDARRYYLEVIDSTEPVDIHYGPDVEDITKEMMAVDAAISELENRDIVEAEEAAMEEFHRDYIEDEDSAIEHMDDEMYPDLDDDQGWLNAYGYFTRRHMERVVKASFLDPRMRGIGDYGPVHAHCRMHFDPRTHKSTNEFVMVVYIRSIGDKYATAYCRWGPIHIPGKLVEWYGDRLEEGMKVPMGISYSPLEEGNHKPFRAKFGIDIWGHSGHGVLATSELPKVHMNYDDAVANHEEAILNKNQ